MTTVNILPQNTPLCQIPYQLEINDRADILVLADACLEQFNRHWGAWIATGDDTAFRLAMNAREDRAQLLREMER